MIVYRIADTYGRGPYQCLKGTEATLLDDCLMFHPCPNEDLRIGRDIYRWEVCGFLTIESLTQWFGPNGRRFLHDNGFLLWVIDIDAPYLTIGERQVLMVKNQIKVVEKRSLIIEEAMKAA
jgi:hypothetical protein